MKRPEYQGAPLVPGVEVVAPRGTLFLFAAIVLGLFFLAKRLK